MNLQMELTNYCNFKCVECPHRLMERKQEHMSSEVFEAIKKDYIQQLDFGTIILHKDGEPLLHPRFANIVQSISAVSSAKFNLYTNGMFLTRDIIDLFSNLKNKCYIFISFHFENVDGSRNSYKSKSKEIENLIASANSNVEFIMVTHLIRENDREQLNDWKQKWNIFQVDNKSLSAIHINECINPWCKKIDVGNLVCFDACPYADGAHLFIGSTGNILPCCMDLEEEIVFGNVLKESRENIMEKQNCFYEDLVNKKYNRDLCRRCLNV